jgi:hypothetical protein
MSCVRFVAGVLLVGVERRAARHGVATARVR